ncbi:MAG: phosphatidate cytidylyltransferase [Desulfurivibrionaceae bacterium]|nr:phosphatidate cytidylyltransferase [Desulfurivibrionaceae bacterium]
MNYKEIIMITAPDPALYWILIMIYTSLVAGSIGRFIALRHAEETKRRQRLASLRTWWLLVTLVSAGLLAGRLGICLLLTAASCLAWFEITAMFRARPQDRLAIGAGYVLIVINYVLILLGSISLFVVFIPISSLLVLAVSLLIKDEPTGYIRSAGALLWGIMFLGYGVSHAALLLILPSSSTGPIGPAGWFLFLVILTETDDIFQAIIGRRFGAHNRHRITPTISPHKTWEGFFGGMLVIVILAPLIAPWLTTLGRQAGPFALSELLQPVVGPMLAALLISFAGFFGDINMSAVKRDSGVKESGKLLPGMGGVIDRIDSLTMAAPVFVYFLTWWMA